jgi:hypothetical protein
MKNASLAAGWAQLNLALKTVRLHWEEVQAGWKDPVRQDFEENFWEPLEPQVRAALKGIDGLAQALAQMQHECS